MTHPVDQKNVYQFPFYIMQWFDDFDMINMINYINKWCYRVYINILIQDCATAKAIENGYLCNENEV